MDVRLRLVTQDDAVPLTRLLRVNRDYLAPWEPLRQDEFFTESWQVRDITEALDQHVRGIAYPYVVLMDGEVAGRIAVNGVFRGAFQSANMGYWVAQEFAGKGVATAAVAAAVRSAFGELGLHRVQAATLVNNRASRRVLERNGFATIGVAPGYTQIAGRWQDHLLHQRLSTDA